MPRALVGALLLAPVLAGLAGALLPAFNWFPVLGRDVFGLGAFAELLAVPGVRRSLTLSIFSGILATAVSTALALTIPGLLFGGRAFGSLRRLMAPILALPHITVAVGLLFLLQPSGWMSRLASPWLTGWERPPNVSVAPDEFGLVLVLGLVIKEVPFLVLMMLAAMGQVDTGRMLVVARSLGYGRIKAWFTILVPQLWPRMRLAVMIVLVFSLSVVDMAIVLAPTTPAPLAVRTLQWYSDPDLDRRFVASAAAVLQLGIAVAAMLSLLGIEKGLALLLRGIPVNGRRGWGERSLPGRAFTGIVSALGLLPLALAMLGMGASLVWSVAASGRFPDAFPAGWTLRYWARLGGDLGQVVLNTLILGVVSAGVSLVLAVWWLEYRGRAGAGLQGRAETWLRRLVFLPLLIPQIGFLFGLQVMLLLFGLDGQVLAVIWIHSLYVFPYVWLSLAPIWQRWNPQWGMVAAVLGQGPARRFLSVKLPMLLTPLLTSFAIGFSVSAALYLPTVFAGNARIQTLTVEAVTLASGAGRQPLGVATGLQMLLPLMVFVGAGLVSHWRFRRFSGLS